MNVRLPKVFGEKPLPWLVMAVLLMVNGVIAWAQFLFGARPSLGTTSIVAVIGTALAMFMIRRELVGSRRSAAEDEEGVVADSLQQLAVDGWEIFDDVYTGEIAIDHVLIGPAGIFTVEAQTCDKPAGREIRVAVRREGISIAGGPADMGLIARATDHASWLSEQLKQSTSKAYRVQPVILFAGSRVDQKSPRKAKDPWVAEPKAFIKGLQRKRAALTEEQIVLASVHFSRLIRAARH